MIADFVKFILLVSIAVCRVRAFSQFYIENEKPQSECTLAILARFGKTHPIWTRLRGAQHALACCAFLPGDGLSIRCEQPSCQPVRHEVPVLPGQSPEARLLMRYMWRQKETQPLLLL